jgi:hypothetical protein
MQMDVKYPSETGRHAVDIMTGFNDVPQARGEAQCVTRNSLTIDDRFKPSRMVDIEGR